MRDEPEVEARRIIVPHRQLIISSVLVNKPHLLDRIPGLIELHENIQKVIRYVDVADDFPLTRIALKVFMENVKVPQIPKRQSAIILEGFSLDAGKDFRRYLGNAETFRTKPRRRNHEAQQNSNYYGPQNIASFSVSWVTNC